MNKHINTNVLSVTVESVFTGNRLDKFLCDRFVEHSRSRIKSLILAGYVLNGTSKITDPSYRVKPGDYYEIIIPAVEPAIPIGQNIDLNIVYEDDDLIVIDKPSGFVVHPAAGNRDNTLVNALIAHCGKSLSGIGGKMRPGIVHRLDKDTSGLIVAAKNDRAHRGLAQQFADHTINRAYKAVVWGVPKVKSGVIQGNIGRNPRNRKKMAIVKRGGKHAITNYQVEKKLGTEGSFRASLVECRLETGRTHQIRVHLTSIGNPIIGDPIYGSKVLKKPKDELSVNFFEAAAKLKGQALHAYILGFSHPVNGEKVLFNSLIPPHISALLK